MLFQLASGTIFLLFSKVNELGLLLRIYTVTVRTQGLYKVRGSNFFTVIVPYAALKLQHLLWCILASNTGILRQECQCWRLDTIAATLFIH